MSTASSISAPPAFSACWACGVTLGESPLVCASCGKVQPAAAPGKAADYFQVFGLARKFSLNGDAIGALEREFHRLSRRLHPDRFVRATPEEQQWSLANTALLNDAYRTLRDPIRRTEYLLQLEGLKVGEENSGRNKSADRQPPADLLEEVFELNMQLEEMRMNQKIGENDPALVSDLTGVSLRFESMLADLDRELAEEGSNWDEGDAPTREKTAKEMAGQLDRRRYLRNLVRDVNEVLSTGEEARKDA